MKTMTIGLLSMFAALNAAYANTAQMNYTCHLKESGLSSILKIEKLENAYIISATSKDLEVFKIDNQRPSLSVRVNEVASSALSEFIEFNNSSLEVIPVDNLTKIEIDIASTTKTVLFTNPLKSVRLECDLNVKKLLTFLGIKPRLNIVPKDVKAVAFDIDDTLLFTSPTFTRGFATGGLPKPDDILFWTYTNACDVGCIESQITLADGSVKTLPANQPSSPKAKALELIAYHNSHGHKVYAITARPDINGEPLRKYVEEQLGINAADVFFEPDIDQPGNPAGKTDLIEKLNLDIFYGDSDSDITDTRKAFLDSSGNKSKDVLAIRFLRSPNSSNRKSGKLNKYHPGYFGEPILSDSY